MDVGSVARVVVQCGCRLFVAWGACFTAVGADSMVQAASSTAYRPTSLLYCVQGMVAGSGILGWS